MEITLTIFISALFTFWVWNLKQELSDLQKRADGTEDILPTQASSRNGRRGGGEVPTWSIE